MALPEGEGEAAASGSSGAPPAPAAAVAGTTGAAAPASAAAGRAPGPSAAAPHVAVGAAAGALGAPGPFGAAPAVPAGGASSGGPPPASGAGDAARARSARSESAERRAKRQRLSLAASAAAGGAPTGQAAAASEIFGSPPREGSSSSGGRLFLGAQTATVEWRIEDFAQQRRRADGACLDGPKFGPREPWQVFCHPDGRCFNQPQGGPPGVFLRYLGPHERVPAYATIEKLVNGEFCIPENNARDAPFVVLFGRNEIEEWGVCKDFGLFDDAFGRGLPEDALTLRARVAWIEPRADSLLPNEVVSVGRNAAPSFAGAEGSIQADLAALWCARQARCAGPSGGPALFSVAGLSVSGDVVLVCEQQRFDADRAILAARSSFFRAMLSNRQYREAAQHEVELPDLSARTLAAALRFVYTDEGPDLRTQEEAEDLLLAASKLGISGMMRLCSDRLRDQWLTVASAVSLLRLADEHGASALRSEALAVIGANFDHVKATPEWEELLRSGMNPSLIQDTLQAVADAAIFAGRASIKL